MQDINKIRRMIAIKRIEEAKKAEKERLEAEMFARWQKDPAAWLEERFGEDKRAVIWDLYDIEAYKNHTWDGTKNPLWEMWQSIADNQWVGAMSGTGTGKTYILSRIVFWFLDCFENSLVVTSAPKQDQLELLLWSEMSRAFHKFQKIRPNAKMNQFSLYADYSHKMYSKSWAAEAFVAGVEASSESTTKAQGFHREHMLIITEETVGMPLPTMNAFMNTATGDHNPILAVGNPNSKTDTLAAFINSNPKIKAVQISSLDHPNIVSRPGLIPGAVSLQSIKQKESQFGAGTAMYNSRVRGICPDQSVNSLIKLAWIRAAFVESAEKWDAWDGSNNAVGVDVANSVNGDAAGVCYGKQNLVLLIKEFQCPSASHLAYNLCMDQNSLLQKGYQVFGIPTVFDMNIAGEYIGVDSVGLGISTVNTLRDNGHDCLAISGPAIKELIPSDNDGKPVYNFSNIRSQALWLLRDDLQHGRIGIVCADNSVKLQIEKELSNINYQITDRMFQVEPKDKIKQKLGGKSPTYLDILMYWNLARRDRKMQAPSLPFFGGN